ncbi:TIGR02611 family protein [Streptomyces sp. H27-D2]|uniref:TIGR02611 family protein n=1 Tax=Streptomyces sp. H27-D2 TaxID=3046304 RepID=UPI002DBC0CB9|nr:TIGR02611 family protein [Streptomyces sp. H27-D2]MEC4020973.1 TIGR02611 family protein [Streptomyces sp. H27-D2]
MNAESDGRRGNVDEAPTDAATGDGTTAAKGDGTTAATGGGSAGALPLGSRAPRFIKASRTLHLSWQVGVFVVGLAIVAAGIVMLPLPGPGWLVIFGGIAVWATEFVWAQLVLRWTKHKVTQATQKALDPRVRRRNVILMTIGLVIIAAAVSVYVWKFGLEMPWNVNE